MGLEENADAKTIKKAFRVKARELHPDVNPAPDAEERFQKMMHAYLVLSDPEKKAVYDQEIPEVTIPPRKRRPPPPQAYGKSGERKFWHFLHPGPKAATHLEYDQYSLPAKIIGAITFLFATTFLLDIFLHTDHEQLTVSRLQTKALITKKTDDINVVIVNAGDMVFEKGADQQNELQIGEEIDLRKSAIYGHFKYKRSSDASFKSASMVSTIVQVGALLIYLVSLVAIFARKSPETKFNAALVSAFLSLVLLVFLFLT